MSTAVVTTPIVDRDARAGILLASGAMFVAAAAAFLAGWLPLGFSIVTVFLFAGPHNWIEARYFLARMPARWGRLRSYFFFAFTGIFGLTATYAAMPWLARNFEWGETEYYNANALWNTALLAWILVLVQMRSRQNPRREWFWTLPVAFFLIALNWMSPYVFGLAQVYIHPLIALWVLDRELRRSRPSWRPAYHLCLCFIPLLLGILWWRLADAPPLPTTKHLHVSIVEHAGAQTLPGVSSHLLVATHTFLEMVHYGIWVIVIPLVAMRMKPWTIDAVPLARRSPVWRKVVLGIVITGAVVMLALWAFFLADYSVTRDVYFTVAMLHVLAEVPFLLRAL